MRQGTLDLFYRVAHIAGVGTIDDLKSLETWPRHEHHHELRCLRRESAQCVDNEG
jgi:hypothetical protein